MELVGTAPPVMTMEIAATPCGPLRPTAVRTIEEASAIFRAIRDRLEAGSLEMSEALIRDEMGIIVAHVSYNGRVWWGAPESWTPESKAIFNP